MGNGAAGLEHQLPLPMVEKGTDSDIGAEDGEQKHTGQGGDDPARVYDFVNVLCVGG